MTQPAQGSFPNVLRAGLFVIATIVAASAQGAHQENPRFQSEIELVNVTATVTDDKGRFVADLRKEDFSLYEDGKPQSITQFTRERGPVSIGILLDASGSMSSEKLKAAKAAISHLIFGLLEKEDELFFVEFGFNARLTQGWTADRTLIRHALQDVSAPTGDTALYDAIALALPTAQEGRHVKKALLVVSDGHDTRSAVSASALRQAIMESDVLVYALGMDTPPQTERPRDSRADVDALQRITAETGGRTEVVRDVAGLDAAVGRIATEFRQQYSLGYASSSVKDGRWHSIRVDVHKHRLNVRARRGYVASTSVPR
jgi:Ca-activated chloride channel family protein